MVILPRVGQWASAAAAQARSACARTSLLVALLVLLLSAPVSSADTTVSVRAGLISRIESASSILAAPWPGSPAVTTVDGLNVLGGNMSGLQYEPSGSTAPGVLWAVQNGPSRLYRLVWDAGGSRWTPDPAGWSAGRALRYVDGTGEPDAEGVTMTAAGAAGGLYVSTERNNANSGVSRPAVLRYDSSGVGASLTATHEWNLTPDLPALGSNLGLEGITWIPDSYLVAHGFYDEGRGQVYAPAAYPLHGTGIFFVGVEGNSSIYGYALNSDGTFARVATFSTGWSLGVMELAFDRDRQDFWATCDNTCGGMSARLTINQSTGRFGVAALYERPADMPNINNEGFAVAADQECVSGYKPAFWADDGNTGGHALRAGTVSCTVGQQPTPTPTPVPTSTPTSTSTPTRTPPPTSTVAATATATLTATATATATASPTATPALAGCAPRPPLAVQVVRTGDGRLKVVLTAGAGAIQSVRFGTDDRPMANASIDLPGVAPDLRAGFLYQPAAPPTRLTFYLRPLAGSLATTVPLVITDGCGAWQTVVGGGPSAF